jgi:hypothetical protein
MGKKRPFSWLDTHWIVHSPVGFWINSDIVGQMGELHKLHKDEIISVISEPIERPHNSMANYDYVKILYQGTVWHTYPHRITGTCKRLK